MGEIVKIKKSSKFWGKNQKIFVHPRTELRTPRILRLFLLFFYIELTFFKMWNSYVMNLKIFIDDNITFNNDSSFVTWMVQQYLLVN